MDQMLAIDMREVEGLARHLHATADQIPYAMMIALNDATNATRSYLIKTTWPTHVNPRNPSFIAAALTTKDARASKTNLSTEIYDRFAASGRDAVHMTKQAKGGVVVPRGRHIAVPVGVKPRSRRGAGGLRKKLPDGIRIGDAIYTRTKGRLKLEYVLKRSVKIPKRVPFYEDYQRVMGQELAQQIPKAFAKAMATRRR